MSGENVKLWARRPKKVCRPTISFESGLSKYRLSPPDLHLNINPKEPSGSLERLEIPLCFELQSSVMGSDISSFVVLVDRSNVPIRKPASLSLGANPFVLYMNAIRFWSSHATKLYSPSGTG